VPVICCGNAGVGGAGKTTLVLDLCARLQARPLRVHLLTRGHGGAARGPLAVDPARHTVRDVGDEALLLARAAPTWLGADRAATARAAIAAGAQVLLMDDGLQNPTLAKTASLLVVDGPAGFGNGRVLPAGPLREPVRAAAARCAAAILVGEDEARGLARLPPGLPVLRADLRPGDGLAALAGRPVVAFAGIGRPEKFFAMLEAAGVAVARRVPFADHHVFSPAELGRLARLAAELGAVPVTTPKDHMRIPAAERAGFAVLGVRLAWRDEAALDALLDRLVPG
jgi:tetraacyldisaccharide 4'-kinase